MHEQLKILRLQGLMVIHNTKPKPNPSPLAAGSALLETEPATFALAVQTLHREATVTQRSNSCLLSAKVTMVSKSAS